MYRRTHVHTGPLHTDKGFTAHRETHTNPRVRPNRARAKRSVFPAMQRAGGFFFWLLQEEQLHYAQLHPEVDE